MNETEEEKIELPKGEFVFDDQFAVNQFGQAKAHRNPEATKRKHGRI